MAIPAGPEWADYTKTTGQDPQLNTRIDPHVLARITAFADELRVTPSGLSRLVMTLLVDDEVITQAKLRAARSRTIRYPSVTPESDSA